MAPDTSTGGEACASDAACRLLLGTLGPCEQAACEDGACVRAPVTDGTACRPDDQCLVAGQCQVGACVSDAARDCDDGNPCTEDGCEPSVGCTQQPLSGTACDDGDPCTLGDACAAGACEPGEALDCEDDNPCTVGEACVDGACVPGQVPPCDDGNGCTTADACDPATGECVGVSSADCACDEPADCAAFEDGDLCNGTLTCADGACVVEAGTVVTCEASDEACVTTACDPTTGACEASPVPDGTACDDGNPCTPGDACVGGVCGDAAALDCDDGNPCTADSCAEASCIHPFDDSCACEGDACTPTGEPGDALSLVDSLNSPVETVGVAITDGFVLTCGGFGMDAFRIVGDGAGLIPTGSALQRCQNILPGPMLEEGKRLVWVTHHGDAYVKVPALHTVVLGTDEGWIAPADPIPMPELSAEGMAWDPETDMLWLAVHEAGLRRYEIAEDGTPSLLDAHDGFDNAWHLVLAGEYAYVADGSAGLKVVDRATGEIVGQAATAGFAKDVEVVGTMALVAASSGGVHAFDVSDPTSPETLEVVFTHGSAQQVDLLAGGTRLAVANVDDVLVLDVSHPTRLQVLAVDRGTTKSTSPRNLALAAGGDLVATGEWLGLGLLRWQEGLVAPEFHPNRGSLTIAGVGPGETITEKLSVLNRGWLPLEVSGASTTSPSAWTVSPTSFTLQPGQQQAVSVSFHPSAPGQAGDALTFQTNDPDEPSPSLPIVGNPATTKLDVGDELTSSFDFLDTGSPTGQQSVDNLEGHVLVLAYFATF